MINVQCIQQVGITLGQRQVFAFDNVYIIEGDSRRHVGKAGHGPRDPFYPRVRLTDEEHLAVMDGINAHRAKYSRPPIDISMPPAKTIGEVAAMQDALQAISEVDDE